MPVSPPASPPGVAKEARLLALEHNLEVHARQIETLAETIAQQGRQFQEALDRQAHDMADSLKEQAEESRRQFHDLNENLADLGRPKWNTYIAAAVFCLTFALATGGAALAPLYLTTNLLWKEAERSAERFAEHEELANHPAGEVRIVALQEAVDNLAVRLLASQDALERNLRRELLYRTTPPSNLSN